MDKIIAQEVVNNSSAVAEAVKLIVCGSIGGAIVGGIVGALGKLWVDRKLELQRARYNEKLAHIEAELAKKHTIHKLQFEKEFAIYVEFWGYLSKLREACSALIPGGQFTDKSPQELRDEQAENFATSYTKVIELIEHKRPFYAPNVYKFASKLLGYAWRQMIQHAFDKETPLIQRYEQMRERVDNICTIIDDIESSIRERIGTMGNARLVE